MASAANRARSRWTSSRTFWTRGYLPEDPRPGLGSPISRHSAPVSAMTVAGARPAREEGDLAEDVPHRQDAHPERPSRRPPVVSTPRTPRVTMKRLRPSLPCSRTTSPSRERPPPGGGDEPGDLLARHVGEEPGGPEPLGNGLARGRPPGRDLHAPLSSRWRAIASPSSAAVCAGGRARGPRADLVPHGDGEREAPVPREVCRQLLEELDRPWPSPPSRGALRPPRGAPRSPSCHADRRLGLRRVGRGRRSQILELLLQEFEDHVSRLTRRSVRGSSVSFAPPRPPAVSPRGDSGRGTGVASQGSGG